MRQKLTLGHLFFCEKNNIHKVADLPKGKINFEQTSYTNLAYFQLKVKKGKGTSVGTSDEENKFFVVGNKHLYLDEIFYTISEEFVLS